MRNETPNTSEPTPLTPPNGDDVLSLEAPSAAGVVVPTQAPRMAPAVPAEARPQLDAKVEQFLAKVSDGEVKSPEMNAQTEAIRSMGDIDIRRASETSNRLLQSPVNQIGSAAVSESSKVSKTLLDLRRTIEELDPSQTKKKGLFRSIPFSKQAEDYFRKYQGSQQHLNGILHALRSGQDELNKDNVALNMEKQQLWDTMSRLNQYIYMSEQLDARLTAQLEDLKLTDPERARALEEDVLFYVRQKHQDLLTQLAVSVQAYLAIDIIIKNNRELVKGVDRAATTTVSALRTAVITAQALGNQTMVLDQITALNDTTSGLISRTSEMLKDNSSRIQQQAASSTVQLEALEKAFANIYQTIDTIDNFKHEALANMSQTINVLEGEVLKTRNYLERASRNTGEIEAASSLELPEIGR